MTPELFEQYNLRFKCKFPAAIEIFSDCLHQATQLLPEQDVNSYIDGVNFLSSIGQGAEPVLTYMQEMPEIAWYIGPKSLKLVSDYAYKLARSPNKKALTPLLKSLKPIGKNFKKIEHLMRYFEIIDNFVDKTQTVIHGHNSLYESSGLIPLLNNMHKLIAKLNLLGVSNFIDYGARNYRDSPEQQIEYFSLLSHDAKSIIARERQGTTFKSIEYKLIMARDCLWDFDINITAFSTYLDQIKPPEPYLDDKTMAVPDIYVNKNNVSGLNRYRATLAHMMAHKRWSGKLMADNYAPQMQLMVSVFEDARVDVLAMRLYPGLRKYFFALHPYPKKNACDGQHVSTLRYRASRMSRTLIDPNFDPKDGLMKELREDFKRLLANDSESSTQEMSNLGTKYFIQSRMDSDSLPNIYFYDTEVGYHDDNRCFWHHYEEYDEADEIIPNEYQKNDEIINSIDNLPPRYYDEWDYVSQSYRPDWTTVYERLHPSGDANKIDQLMGKHGELAKRLKRLIEVLKPQNKKRIRFQEEGEELDLDMALRSLIDFKSGQAPDLRINYNYTHDSRNIAVMLLVDSSESLNKINEVTGQSLLELSQEALAITAWTINEIGDKFAIAGFSSDTRSQVRYQHIKGFSESYGNEVKARIAAMDASYSTRMGAAMRHAAHYLESQVAEKKLMIVLTDGEPADVDVKDPLTLIKDTKKAVEELKTKGIYTYCITLDKNADDYVNDIFANHYTVIDHVDKLPEQLPKVFLELTQ